MAVSLRKQYERQNIKYIDLFANAERLNMLHTADERTNTLLRNYRISHFSRCLIKDFRCKFDGGNGKVLGPEGHAA